jgi:hypothetical protein
MSAQWSNHQDHDSPASGEKRYMNDILKKGETNEAIITDIVSHPVDGRMFSALCVFD